MVSEPIPIMCSDSLKKKKKNPQTIVKKKSPQTIAKKKSSKTQTRENLWSSIQIAKKWYNTQSFFINLRYELRSITSNRLYASHSLILWIASLFVQIKSKNPSLNPNSNGLQPHTAIMEREGNTPLDMVKRERESSVKAHPIESTGFIGKPEPLRYRA